MLTGRFYTPFLLMFILLACQTAPKVAGPTSPAATASPLSTVTPLPTATVTAAQPTHPPAEPVAETPEQILTPINQTGGKMGAMVANGDEVYFNRGPRLFKSNRLTGGGIIESEVLPVLPQTLYLLDNVVYAQMSDQTLWAFTVDGQWQRVGMLALPAGVREIITAEGELHIYSQPDETKSQLDSYNSQLQLVQSLSLPPNTAVEDYPRLYQVTAAEISQTNAQKLPLTFTPLTGFDFSIFEGWGVDNKQLLANWTFANGRVYFRNSTKTPQTFTTYEVVENQLILQNQLELGDMLFFSELAIHQSQLFVVTNNCEGSGCQGGLTWYDLDNPSQPFVDEATLEGEILDMDKSENGLYLLTENMLQLVGSLNGELVVVPLYTSPSPASRLVFWENNLWVQGSPAELSRYDLTRPGPLQLASVISASYQEWFIVRDQLYGQDGLGNFYALQAAEGGGFPSISTPLPHWPGPSGAKNWLAQDNVAAGLDPSGLHFVEIVSPLEIRSAGQYSAQFNSFIWYGNLIAAQKLTNKGSQITLLDVADRTNIQLLSVTEDLGTPLAFYEDYLYLYQDGFLTVVDISHPQKPKLWHQIVLPAPLFGLKIEGTVGYGLGNDLWIFDLSDPARPRLMGHAPTAGVVQDVLVVDQRLYVADGAGGLLVFER